MIDTILNFKFDSLLALVLYWVPLVFCALFYIVRSGQDFANDKRRREFERTYYPTITIGTLIGRGLASVIPVVNLFAAIFDVSPVAFKKMFTLIGEIFDQPLVPQSK